jgi:hypothetical protein
MWTELNTVPFHCTDIDLCLQKNSGMIGSWSGSAFEYGIESGFAFDFV